MRLRVPFSSAFVVCIAALGVTLAQACGGTGDNDTTSSSTTGGGAPGTGGSGGSELSACDKLCEHVRNIACSSWKDCDVDCANKLGAPADCAGAFDALLGCWVDHMVDFVCTQTQVIPPGACLAEEEAFHECFESPSGVDTSCICSSGVGNTSDTSCGRKTLCGASEYGSVCAASEAGPWTCACYDGTTLLGTCSEPSDLMPHCDNKLGCCTVYFCDQPE